MLAVERQDAIRDRLARDGRVLANALAREFGVSEDTIRRDLRDLAKVGICRKVYGGALADAPSGGSIAERTKIAATAKAGLAAVAAKLVLPGQTILIDAGTTNMAIAAALPRDVPINVVTNAPGIAVALGDHPLACVVVLGGLYNADKGACLGATTLREVGQINADLFFLGACGLHPSVGVSAFDPAEAEVKRAMWQRSASLAVAATSDKISTVAPFQITAPNALDHLIVERELDPEILAPYRAQGTAIHFAD